MSSAASHPSKSTSKHARPIRIGQTLDIDPTLVEAYKIQHDQQWPEVRNALHSVGIRNLSLWNFENRLFLYAEYVGEEPIEKALARYAKMPRVAEWEELMHMYQRKVPGCESEPGWWQPCTEIFYQQPPQQQQ